MSTSGSPSPPSLSDEAVLNIQNFSELLTLCQEHHTTIAEVAIRREMAHTGRDRDTILKGIQRLLNQMKSTIDAGIASTEPSMSGLSGTHAHTLMAYKDNPTSPFPAMGIRLMAYGLATLEENSRMKTIVACPTAGGAGSVPAVLIALEDEHTLPREKTTMGLITAGAIGELVSRRMFLSGSAAGCQAEVGVASGMAAAGMVEALGGSPKQVVQAAAISMQNLMGLVCDPVAGLVEVPCVVRNGLSGIQSAASATMALAGIESFVPLDEVVDAMAEVGRLMSPKLKETAEGGLAATPTAQQFSHQFFQTTRHPADSPQAQQ